MSARCLVNLVGRTLMMNLGIALVPVVMVSRQEVVTISHTLFYHILRLTYSLFFNGGWASHLLTPFSHTVCYQHTVWYNNTNSHASHRTHALTWGPDLDFEKCLLTLLKDRHIIGLLYWKKEKVFEVYESFPPSPSANLNTSSEETLAHFLLITRQLLTGKSCETVPQGGLATFQV